VQPLSARDRDDGDLRMNCGNERGHRGVLRVMVAELPASIAYAACPPLKSVGRFRTTAASLQSSKYLPPTPFSNGDAASKTEVAGIAHGLSAFAKIAYSTGVWPRLRKARKPS
jgi:hypothetical protein